MGILSLFCCINKNSDSKGVNNDTIKLVNMVVDTSEGFCDVSLQIISDSKESNSHIFIVKGLYKKQPIGIQVEINSTAEAGIVNNAINNKAVISNGLKLTSIGKESDNFVHAIADLYKFPTAKGFSKAPITGSIFNLNEFEGNMDEKKYYKFKVFFEENNEELYSEMYININQINRQIDFHEKDIEYRKPLIKVWTK